MSRQRALLGFLVLMLLVIGVVAWPYLFEKVEETVEGPYEGEAAKNPLFALQEMLRRLDVPTESQPQLKQLPPADHVLVLASPGWGYNVGDVERLLEWTRQGGHLVVTPSELDDEDPLLYEVDIWGFHLEQPWEDGVEETAQLEAVDEEIIEDETVADSVAASPDEEADADQPISVFDSDRRPWLRLYFDGEAEILRADGPIEEAWMLTVQVGRGALTALADGAIFTNVALAEKDHALIVLQAVALDELPVGVVLVYGEFRPSIWALMTARAWPIGISLIVLVLAALANLARRVGPKLEDPDLERRHLEEHVCAVGHFFWRRGLEDTLIRSARRAKPRTSSSRQKLPLAQDARAKVCGACAKRSVARWSVKTK